MTHLEHATFPTRVTLKFFPQTKANLLQATLTTLLKGHTQKMSKPQLRAAIPHKFQCQKKSPFKIHSWTPPQNQTVTLDSLNY